MMDFFAEHYPTLMIVVPALVGAASMAVAAIAPFTKNKADDEVAGWLKKAHSFLSKVALNPKS